MPGGDGMLKVSWTREERAQFKAFPKGALFAIAVEDKAYSFCSGGPIKDGTQAWQMFRFWTEMRNGMTPQAAFKAVFEKPPEKQKTPARPSKKLRKPSRRLNEKRARDTD